MERVLKKPTIEALYREADGTTPRSGCPTAANAANCQHDDCQHDDALVGDGFCHAHIEGFADEACGYDGGDCLLPVFDRNDFGDSDTNWLGLVFLSVECKSLYFNGETELAGYVGSRASFDGAEGSCAVCPGDHVFGGSPIRTASGDYVCDGAPEGTVDTGNSMLSGTGCAADHAAGGIGRDCAEGEVAIVVYPKFENQFPSATPAACVDPLASTRQGVTAQPTGVCGAVTELANKKKCEGTVAGAACTLNSARTDCAVTAGDANKCIFNPANGATPASCTGTTEGSCAQTTTTDCFDGTTAGCESDDSNDLGEFRDACAERYSEADCAAVDSDSDVGTADCKFTQTMVNTDGSKKVKCRYVPGTQYRLALSAGEGNEEVVYVQYITGRNIKRVQGVHLNPWASSYASPYRVYGVF
jgi:hypothetical protein